VLAVHPEAEAGDRNADLGRRDVAVLLLRIGENGGHPRRHVVALRGLMVDAGARRADDREFSGDEQTIREHQQQDDGDRNQDLDHSSAPSGSAATRRASTATTARSATRSTSNS
jgi:hypothetical protein